MDNLLAWFNPSRWIALGIVVLALFGAGTWAAHALKESGREEVRAEAVRAENAEVKALNTTLLRQAEKLMEVQTNYEKATQELDSALQRWRTSDDAWRMQYAAITKQIDTASVGACRRFAATALDTYQACRIEYQEMGRDAIRGSKAAHTLNDWQTFNNNLKEVK